jgi:hypothetical protein
MIFQSIKTKHFFFLFQILIKTWDVAQIFCDLLLHINRTTVDALSSLGRVYPTRVNNLGLQRLPRSSRTATTHFSLPCMTGTGTTLRSSPSLINLPLLDLIRCSFFRIINAEVTVLGSVLRVRRDGALGEEDKSQSPNAVDETRNPSVEGLQVTRYPPDLSLEWCGWVEGLGGGA